MTRIVQTIDLTDDPAVLAEYDRAHAVGNTPPAVLSSQRRHGVSAMDIYRVGNRLVMIMEVGSKFDPEGLEADAAADPIIVDWHRRIGVLQRPIDGGGGWAAMTRVFSQSEHP